MQQQQGLEPDLAAALQTIPGWTWQCQVSVLSDAFQQNLQELAAYAERFGPPPKRSKRSSREGKSSSKNKPFDTPTEAEHNRAADISKQVCASSRCCLCLHLRLRCGSIGVLVNLLVNPWLCHHNFVIIMLYKQSAHWLWLHA
jgi:hypothetical protein